MAPPPSPDERVRYGRARRKRLPRSEHAATPSQESRPDPVAVLAAQGADRLPELLPLRYSRMAAGAFPFLRGAVAVMTADLAAAPHTGLVVQLCGDAHLLNFGLYASPERALLFDLNDFDETLPGPFEWDVKRLAASVAVAARDNGHGDKAARRAAGAAAAAYRRNMRRLAGLGELAVWYERVDSAEVLPLVRRRHRERVASGLERARRRTGPQTLDKLAEVVDGRLRLRFEPPLLEPVGSLDEAVVEQVFREYRASLPEERRLLLDRFHVVDVARKVVGVGSVGTRCFVVLLTGRDDADPLFLQIKEAVPSVLEAHLGRSAHPHSGHRVVAGQRLLQAAGDIFLGWATGPEGRHFYWRQLRDMKGSADVASMDPLLLEGYARLCGRTLARAHARTGDRFAIAGYLGAGDAFDEAVTRFALDYADLTVADHAALTAALTDTDNPSHTAHPAGHGRAGPPEAP
ncbi:MULTISPECIES: DUF2252 domain-containing protein [unclassified Streptomyces]|uniref:DUF2252 domain-containing protein n=1 Tax=unclassified Streptomyces TaxID=2593676 RepID=UPI00299FCE56|nr:DUF2252 domain-containing protein [Streptomyces sp. DK15]MDX2391343.1 DUF2252 domain-containing protein [Streptomyces sp. DK15]